MVILKWANLPSFAISFATAPAALANCPPLSRVISMLCMAVPKGISVEVFFFLKKKPSQTVQASAFGLRRVGNRSDEKSRTKQ
jgi:hypothetical protein